MLSINFLSYYKLWKTPKIKYTSHLLVLVLMLSNIIAMKVGKEKHSASEIFKMQNNFTNFMNFTLEEC